MNEIRIEKEKLHVKSADREFKKYLGYKFYYVDENDHVDIVRITALYKESPNVLVTHTETGKTESMNIEKLGEKYTPLAPKGFIMVAHVSTRDKDGSDNEDVIVTLYNHLDAAIGNSMPSAVCRQSINDFFMEMMTDKETNDWVGVSVTPDNCPASIDYRLVTACDKVIHTDMFNFYLDDTIDSIFETFNANYYDAVLNNLYLKHMEAVNPLYDTMFRKDKRTSDHGWCRSLKELLVSNNFIADIDSMRMVTALDFDLKEFMNEEDDGVYSFNDTMKDFFNYINHLNVVKTMVIKYDYDINMADFNNSNYIFLRDKNNITWLCVYVCEGEYIEKDLEAEFNKLGVADKLRLTYYDKYHNFGQVK